MRNLSPSGQRRLFGTSVVGVAAVVAYWFFFSDGLPILWGPTARASEIAAGRELFEKEWAANDPEAHGDGLGPVYNATSCAACHFQGGLGGAGGVAHNAVGFEVAPRPGDHAFRTGTVHAFCTDPKYKESNALLRKAFPVIKGRTIRNPPPPPGEGHCGYPTTITIPDFDPLRTQAVQPTALFGAGWVDLISDRAIERNARNRGLRNTVRELSLEFDAVPVGRVRKVAGGVGKFGWKGQFATLSEFVAAACANELGLGTPDAEQARPLAAPDKTAEPDMDRRQFRQLVAFVKTLPKPVEADGGDEAARGRELFASVGCAVCHVPNMGGVSGVYSDFLLYTLDDPRPSGGGGGGEYDGGPPPPLNLPDRPDSEPKGGEWKTPPLWGVADSAPYLHDGSAPTLSAAIQAHRGDAKMVTAKYQALPVNEKAAVLAFLGTLKAPPDAHSLRNPGVTKLAKR